jgi:putative ABC transport system permease protein
MTMSLPQVRYGEPAQVVSFYDRVVEGVRHLPGVNAVAAAAEIPLRDSGAGMSVVFEGRPKPARFEDMPYFLYRDVSPDYFATLGIPLLKGRTFTPDDREGRPRVAVINQAGVRKYFPNEDPIGRRMMPDDDGATPVEIIGVVADVKHLGLDQPVEPEMFIPYTQTPPFIWNVEHRTLNLLVRTATADPTSVVPSIRELVRRLDDTVPTYQVSTMTQVLEQSTATPQRYMVVVTAFGSIALMLAAIGIYGVMTFLVRQRTHEIGVRIALGASRGDVLRLVIGRVLRLTVIGLGLGLALAWTLGRWLGAFLFEITPTDAFAYVAGGVVLFAVALLAAYLPAARATRIDPVTALRVE